LTIGTGHGKGTKIYYSRSVIAGRLYFVRKKVINVNIDNYAPASGRLIDEGGNVVNIVDLLGSAAMPVSASVYDINSYTPRSGRVIGEDGLLYNLVDLLAGAGSGSGGSAVITPATVVAGIANGSILGVATGRVTGITFSYTHTQSTAASVWNVQHNLGNPAVTAFVLDADGEQIVGQWDAQASTNNLLVLRFSEPLAGRAYVKI
jgi:hypothetical protein